MSDNVGYTAGVGTTIASDDIGGVQYQRVKIGVGADGSATDVSSANPMPVVESDPSPATSFGPITTANVVLFAAIDTAGEKSIVLQLTGLWDGAIYLQASQDGTTWFDAIGTCNTNEIAPSNAFYAPGVIVVPATARYFRAITSLDFSGTVSGLYSQRAFDAAPFFQRTTLTDVSSDVRMPVAGLDPLGNLKQIALSETGQVVPADGRVIQGSLSRVGTVWQVDTTGYNSISVQVLGTFSATITFQTSNDATTWASVAGWQVGGGSTSGPTTNAASQLVFPAVGRYFRAQLTAYTSGVVAAVGVLKSAPAFYPASSPTVSVTGTASVNIAQVGAVAVTGGIALGTNGATNGASVSTLIAAGTNNLTQLKSSLGRIHIIDIQNVAVAVRYLKLFNVPSASVTMGTTSATMNFSIPASGKLSIVTDLGLNLGGTGISYATTTGSSLTDNTAVTAGDLIMNFQFV
jgi:hypothetical protein